MNTDDRPTPHGMLVAEDREYLRGEKEYNSRQGVHDRRKAIRARIVNTILDFELADQNLSDEDRRKVRDEVMDELPEFSTFGGPRPASGGVVSTLAFIANLHDDVEHFEQTLDRTFVHIFAQRGSEVPNVETSIEIETGVDTDAAIEKFERGDMDGLTDGEREWLVRALKAIDEEGEAAIRLRGLPPGNRWLTGDAVARRRNDDTDDE